MDLDLFFTLGQIFWLIALACGALLTLKNGALESDIERASTHPKPYLFDSLSSLTPQPGAM